MRYNSYIVILTADSINQTAINKCKNIQFKAIVHMKFLSKQPIQHSKTTHNEKDIYVYVYVLCLSNSVQPTRITFISRETSLK